MPKRTNAKRVMIIGADLIGSHHLFARFVGIMGHGRCPLSQALNCNIRNFIRYYRKRSNIG
jgi:hypothetical protein